MPLHLGATYNQWMLGLKADNNFNNNKRMMRSVLTLLKCYTLPRIFMKSRRSLYFLCHDFQRV